MGASAAHRESQEAEQCPVSPTEANGTSCNDYPTVQDHGRLNSKRKPLGVCGPAGESLARAWGTSESQSAPNPGPDVVLSCEE